MWLLMDLVPKAEVFASVQRFRLLFAGLVAAVVVTSLGLSLFLARRISGPLGALWDGAQRISRGDLAHRLEVDTGDEIQEVAEEFNRMAQVLQETYRQLEERDLAKTGQLQKVTQRLVQSEKLVAVGQLAAGVAHEINNPVGVVSMFVQQLLERGRLSADQVAKLRIIERQTDRIGWITQGLLDFARAREHRRDKFDVFRVVRASLEAMGPRLSAAEIAVEICALEGAEIMGDEHHLQQVFENLVLNAIQAMERQGKLRVDVERREEAVHVKFADTGPGIDGEHLERVFEPFYTTKEVGQGTGLGLAISYGIVKAHSGSMWAENRQEGGALFTVVLPLIEAGTGMGATT